MRYVITPTQAHNLIYKYLDRVFSKKDFRKEINPYVKSGDTYTIEMHNDKGDLILNYYWFEPGEYDDGSPHNGIGDLTIHSDLVDTLRSSFTMRESKILDIIADWVSEKLETDIDTVSVYPKSEKPTVY